MLQVLEDVVRVGEVEGLVAEGERLEGRQGQPRALLAKDVGADARPLAVQTLLGLHEAIHREPGAGMRGRTATEIEDAAALLHALRHGGPLRVGPDRSDREEPPPHRAHEAPEVSHPHAFDRKPRAL